jgi:hypothetical protein
VKHERIQMQASKIPGHNATEIQLKLLTPNMLMYKKDLQPTSLLSIYRSSIYVAFGLFLTRMKMKRGKKKKKKKLKQ